MNDSKASEDIFPSNPKRLDLNEAFKSYIKENLKIEVSQGMTDHMIRVALWLEHEEISSDQLVLPNDSPVDMHGLRTFTGTGLT